MFYVLTNGRAELCEESWPLTGEHLGVYAFADAGRVAAALHLSEAELAVRESAGAASYAFSMDTGLLSLRAMGGKKENFRALIVVRRGLLAVFCEDAAAMEKRLLPLIPTQGEALTRVLCGLLETPTEGHLELHEKIESEIAQLENALLTNHGRDCVQKIASLRKRLLQLKRFYEQTMSAVDELEENDGDLYDEKALRYFRLYGARLDRLYHSVLNLRDYVTQVRESYQAEVDISLNNIMKIFTVITAIFLPLTLIAGWYGMNLKMPEYGAAWTYPAVIGLSLAVVLGMILYFKRKKWF